MADALSWVAQHVQGIRTVVGDERLLDPSTTTRVDPFEIYISRTDDHTMVLQKLSTTEPDHTSPHVWRALVAAWERLQHPAILRAVSHNPNIGMVLYQGKMDMHVPGPDLPPDLAARVATHEREMQRLLPGLRPVGGPGVVLYTNQVAFRVGPWQIVVPTTTLTDLWPYIPTRTPSIQLWVYDQNRCFVDSLMAMVVMAADGLLGRIILEHPVGMQGWSYFNKHNEWKGRPGPGAGLMACTAFWGETSHGQDEEKCDAWGRNVAMAVQCELMRMRRTIARGERPPDSSVMRQLLGEYDPRVWEGCPDQWEVVQTWRTLAELFPAFYHPSIVRKGMRPEVWTRPVVQDVYNPNLGKKTDKTVEAGPEDLYQALKGAERDPAFCSVEPTWHVDFASPTASLLSLQTEETVWRPDPAFYDACLANWQRRALHRLQMEERAAVQELDDEVGRMPLLEAYSATKQLLEQRRATAWEFRRLDRLYKQPPQHGGGVQALLRNERQKTLSTGTRVETHEAVTDWGRYIFPILVVDNMDQGGILSREYPASANVLLGGRNLTEELVFGTANFPLLHATPDDTYHWLKAQDYETRYRLSTVIMHSQPPMARKPDDPPAPETPTGGHYTCYFRLHDNDWYFYDDTRHHGAAEYLSAGLPEHVLHAGQETPMNPRAPVPRARAPGPVVLFYVRTDPPLPTDGNLAADMLRDTMSDAQRRRLFEGPGQPDLAVRPHVVTRRAPWPRGQAGFT